MSLSDFPFRSSIADSKCFPFAVEIARKFSFSSSSQKITFRPVQLISDFLVIKMYLAELLELSLCILLFPTHDFVRSFFEQEANERIKETRYHLLTDEYTSNKFLGLRNLRAGLFHHFFSRGAPDRRLGNTPKRKVVTLTTFASISFPEPWATCVSFPGASVKNISVWSHNFVTQRCVTTLITAAKGSNNHTKKITSSWSFCCTLQSYLWEE